MEPNQSSNGRTWPPASSGGPRFPSLVLQNNYSGRRHHHCRHHHHHHHHTGREPDFPHKRRLSSVSSPSKSRSTLNLQEDPAPGNFSDLPSDVLTRIAASFDVPTLWAASTVCRSWRSILQPLREAMVLLRWGKRFKHGDGNVRRDPGKALESFLKGAARGSAAAMVDAGVMYWEMGRKEEGKALYRKAAELGYPAAECNLGISYLQADPPDHEEAVKWFYRAASSGYARAQYSLALCLHRGNGVKSSLAEAAKWYLNAAEGGYMRAMYNTSLCYLSGEGFRRNKKRAKMWMKRAADCGHSKAQLEQGLQLFSSGDYMKSLVYIELAVRAGESAGLPIKNAILEGLSQTSRERAMLSVDNWRPSLFSS